MYKWSILLLLFALPCLAQEKFTELRVEEEGFEEFEIFEDKLDDYTVYFTGENHNYAVFNTDLELKMLKYLHQTQGAEHFIFEQSPGVAYIIEEIIIDNNKENLRFLKDVFYDPFYIMIKSLKKYNDTLGVDSKVHIHGIDVERFPYFSLYALDRIVDTLDTRVYGGEVFEQIHSLRSSEFELGSAADFYAEVEETGFTFGQVSAWGSLKSIIESSREYRDSLGPVLGEKEEIFYAIIEGLEKGREWYISEKKGDLKSPIVRERFMADEFERIYRSHPDDKFFGQFGRCHLHKDDKAKRCYDYYMNSVANRINDIDSSLTNKVMVIPVYYSQGRENFDKDIIKDLQFDEPLLEEGKAFIVDLAYKNGDHPIVGFYDQLPFLIISNIKANEQSQFEFNWNTTVQEFHLGGYYGYHYNNGIKTLNAELFNAGSNGFTNKWEGWSFAFDAFTVGSFGNRYGFTYYPGMSNGDRFDLNAWKLYSGFYYTFGNKWAMAAFGFDYGYGQVSLKEDLDNTIPNLIQSADLGNVIIYKNDMFTIDPNLELRLTLPFISLNFRTGYAFDISGKYWKLDGKMKDFTKTSFNAPYIQAGISFNYKIIR